MELKISAGQTVRIIVDDAPDPDMIALGIPGAASSARMVRLATANARKLGAKDCIAAHGIMCGLGDLDVHVTVAIDDLGENLADWIRNEVIPRIGDHKLTLEVLR